MNLHTIAQAIRSFPSLLTTDVNDERLFIRKRGRLIGLVLPERRPGKKKLRSLDDKWLDVRKCDVCGNTSCGCLLRYEVTDVRHVPDEHFKYTGPGCNNWFGIISPGNIDQFQNFLKCLEPHHWGYYPHWWCDYKDEREL